MFENQNNIFLVIAHIFFASVAGSAGWEFIEHPADS